MTDHTEAFQIIKTKPQAFEWLHFGEIKPTGWLYTRIWNDLENGFTGHLDELAPALIKEDDIYGEHRLTRNVKGKDLGVLAKDPEWRVQFLWWNSETQSNWWDGLIRSALLTEHPSYLLKVQDYIARKLAGQDQDGYLGIYAPDLRYHFDGENGELWAQATLLRGLLGYYEASSNPKVLKAVLDAVHRTMQGYPIHSSRPFSDKPAFAGSWHGLMFTDVLDRLNQLTGDAAYQEYALWLYQEYCQHENEQTDITVQCLLDPGYRFKGHGVHTYEHLRVLITSLYASGNPTLDLALNEYFDKLEPCLSPSGGPLGDEFVYGRQADPTWTGYEYCSIHELLDSYSLLLQKSGDAALGDRIEWLLFNAGLGARHPEEPAIAYLRTDNSYSMNGTQHSGHVNDNPDNPQTRYKYSPVHQDVAVCCVPNAGRIFPYYVRAMWMRSPNGLIAALYGPCSLKTLVNGVPIQIEENTYYPYSLDIEFVIRCEQPVLFDLTLRKPGWTSGVECSIMGAKIEENEHWIRVKKTWSDEEHIYLHFNTAVKVNSFSNGEQFMRHGPLLYALPLPGLKRYTRVYASGFRDIEYDPVGSDYDYLHLPEQAEDEFQFRERPVDIETPSRALSLRGALWDIRSNVPASVDLVPIGSTVLRKVTFKTMS